MKVESIYQYTSLFTWWWLPSLGSKLLLNGCYSLQLLSPPTSPRIQNNRLQLARTAVIVGTLLYQLYGSITTSPPNYYQLLALPLDVDTDGVKRSFRALARKYHPDKVGEAGEAFFIILRRAHDALSDPTKRFAYDRFGPDITSWKDCESLRDYTKHGLMGLVAFYTINPAIYALFGYMNNGGRTDGLSFWRLACLFSMLAAEVSLLVSPDYPTWMTILLPNTTIFDVRGYARSLFLNFFFASMQLSVALDVLEYGEEGAPPRDKASKAAMAERQLEVIKMKAQGLNQVAEVVAKGVMQSYARELRPFRSASGKSGGKDGKREMGEVEEMIFERIDTVLLGRSLVQQNSQLAQAVLKGQDIASPSVKEEGESAAEGVKEEPLVEEVKVPKPESEPVEVKEEPKEESSLPEQDAAVKVEPTDTLQQRSDGVEQISEVVVVKQEPVEPTFTTNDERASEASSSEPWVQVDPTSTQPQQPSAVEPEIAAVHSSAAATPAPAIESASIPTASLGNATTAAVSSDQEARKETAMTVDEAKPATDSTTTESSLTGAPYHPPST